MCTCIYIYIYIYICVYMYIYIYIYNLLHPELGDTEDKPVLKLRIFQSIPTKSLRDRFVYNPITVPIEILYHRPYSSGVVNQR